MHSRLSGAAARRWRQNVANHSRRDSKIVRTLKFPLDVSSASALDFDGFSELYQITEGIEKGSLAGLIFAKIFFSFITLLISCIICIFCSILSLNLSRVCICVFMIFIKNA